MSSRDPRAALSGRATANRWLLVAAALLLQFSIPHAENAVLFVVIADRLEHRRSGQAAAGIGFDR